MKKCTTKCPHLYEPDNKGMLDLDILGYCGVNHRLVGIMDTITAGECDCICPDHCPCYGLEDIADRADYIPVQELIEYMKRCGENARNLKTQTLDNIVNGGPSSNFGAVAYFDAMEKMYCYEMPRVLDSFIESRKAPAEQPATPANEEVQDDDEQLKTYYLTIERTYRIDKEFKAANNKDAKAIAAELVNNIGSKIFEGDCEVDYALCDEKDRTLIGWD